MTRPQNTYDEPKDNYYATGDTSFSSGESPITLDVLTNLSRKGTNGYIRCDGLGDILVSISSDGSTFGDSTRIKQDETFSLRALEIQSIKITHSGTDSAYRVFVS